MRIYKKGAKLGDPLTVGDTIYFMASINGCPTFIGSSNTPVQSNMPEDIQVYHYVDSTGGQPKQPAYFTTRYLWTIAVEKTAAYTTASPITITYSHFEMNIVLPASSYQW